MKEEKTVCEIVVLLAKRKYTYYLKIIFLGNTQTKVFFLYFLMEEEKYRIVVLLNRNC